MPARCCVPNCGYRFHIAPKDQKVALHGLPKDPKRRKLWLKAIALDRPINLRFAKVCSRHFLDDDYLKKIASGMKILRDNAVPSVFNRPPLQTNSAAEVAPTSEQCSTDVSSDSITDPIDPPDAAVTEEDAPFTDLHSYAKTTDPTDAPITDLHSYARNFICMLRNSRSTSSKRRVPTTENSSSEPQHVASTNSGDRHDTNAPTDKETVEDIHAYSEQLISTLRNAVATDPEALQCGDLTGDEESPLEQNQEEDRWSEAYPTHRDSATSPHQRYADAATSPHHCYVDAATSPHQCYVDAATSPHQQYEEAMDDGPATDCAEDVASQDSSDANSEDEGGQSEKLQYAKHKVAWLRSALTKKDERLRELEQECARLRQEAVALRQRVWLYEAQERYKLKESGAAPKPGSLPTCRNYSGTV